MTDSAKAVKVSIYLSENATRHGVPVSSAVLDFLFYRGVSGATVLKGVAGFGAEHRLHTEATVELSAGLPIVVEFIETQEKVECLLAALQEVAGSGLIEMQETTVVRSAEAEKHAKPERHKTAGRARQMNIYTDEAHHWREKPLHEALVEAMRANGIAGVTVQRGILGYGAHRKIHKEKGLHLHHDASILISVLDSAEKIEAFLPIVEQMVEEGLVVLSDVDVIRFSRGAADVI